MLHRVLMIGSIIAVLVGCEVGEQSPKNTKEAIDTERLSAVVEVLASDEFEGRAPGTPGGRKTVEYLTEQFAALGLEPGGTNGSWIHTVPLIRTQVQTPAALRFSVAGTTQQLQQQTDINVDTVRPNESIAIDSPVV